jgi:hypothetical protein
MASKHAAALAHLSSAQVEELYDRYISGESNAALIDAYQLSIPAGMLVQAFPPFVLDMQCRHCGVQMLFQRPGKSSLMDNHGHAAYCEACGHMEPMMTLARSFRKHCPCQHCKNEAQEATRCAEQTVENAIREQYALDQHKAVAAGKLSLRQLVALAALFFSRATEKLETIHPNNAEAGFPMLLTPTLDADIRFLRTLTGAAIIRPDPTRSPSSAFVLGKDGVNYDYYLTKVHYAVLLSLDGLDRASLKDVWSEVWRRFKETWPRGWEDEVLELWLDIALEECVQYLQLQIAEYGLEFTAGEKTQEILRNLLFDFSVAQIYLFIYRSVKDAAAFYQSSACSGRKHASNTIPGKIKQTADNYRTNRWEVKSFHRDSRAPRSAISQVFFDTVLQLEEDAGFTHPPVTYWNRTLKARVAERVEKNNYEEVNAGEGFLMLSGERLTEVDQMVLGHVPGLEYSTPEVDDETQTPFLPFRSEFQYTHDAGVVFGALAKHFSGEDLDDDQALKWMLSLPTINDEGRDRLQSMVGPAAFFTLVEAVALLSLLGQYSAVVGGYHKEVLLARDVSDPAMRHWSVQYTTEHCSAGADRIDLDVGHQYEDQAQRFKAILAMHSQDAPSLAEFIFNHLERMVVIPRLDCRHEVYRHLAQLLLNESAPTTTCSMRGR